MVVVRVDREERTKVCADCGEEVGDLFLALPVLGVVLCPHCGSTIGRRLQEEAEEARMLSLQDAFSQGTAS